jgi:hypothetical protein
MGDDRVAPHAGVTAEPSATHRELEALVDRALATPSIERALGEGEELGADLVRAKAIERIAADPSSERRIAALLELRADGAARIPSLRLESRRGRLGSLLGLLVTIGSVLTAVTALLNRAAPSAPVLIGVLVATTAFLLCGCSGPGS